MGDWVVTREATLKQIGYDDEAGARVDYFVKTQWLRDSPVKWKDIHLIIEAPSPRIYGRNNTAVMMRIWWQIWYIIERFHKRARSIDLVNSYDWNERVLENGRLSQYKDPEKLLIFQEVFPTFPEIRLPPHKHKWPWGSPDVRDAALMGFWWWRLRKIDDDMTQDKRSREWRSLKYPGGSSS